MGQKLELPYSVWMRLQEVSQDKEGKDAKLAAILDELNISTKEGSLVALVGPQEVLEQLAETIYSEIWESGAEAKGQNGGGN